MTDEDTLLLLSAYHDGELSPREALEMERRLESDPELRARAARLGMLSGALRQTLAEPPVPPSLRANVVRHIGFGAHRPARRELFARLAASAAAFAFASSISISRCHVTSTQ